MLALPPPAASRPATVAAGAATGTTQMGVYVGVFSAPLLTGPIIESAGYTAMWLVVAATVAAGALTSMVIADQF